MGSGAAEEGARELKRLVRHEDKRGQRGQEGGQWGRALRRASSGRSVRYSQSPDVARPPRLEPSSVGAADERGWLQGIVAARDWWRASRGSLTEGFADAKISVDNRRMEIVR